MLGDKTRAERVYNAALEDIDRRRRRFDFHLETRRGLVDKIMALERPR